MQHNSVVPPQPLRFVLGFFFFFWLLFVFVFADLFTDAAETEKMAQSLEDSEGVYFVPSFSGLQVFFFKVNCNNKHFPFLVQLFSCSFMSDSFVAHVLQPIRLLSPWGYFGNTVMGCHFLPHGIFPPQGLNSRISVCCIAGIFFIAEPPGKPLPSSYSQLILYLPFPYLKP